MIQIDAFARLFDGFSISSNDLTQLTLGVDRDSHLVAFDFDQRDPGVLEMLRLTVEGRGATDAIPGSAARRPAITRRSRSYLVRLGIDSMSLNPDSVLEATF